MDSTSVRVEVFPVEVSANRKSGNMLIKHIATIWPLYVVMFLCVYLRTEDVRRLRLEEIVFLPNQKGKNVTHYSFKQEKKNQ